MKKVLFILITIILIIFPIGVFASEGFGLPSGSISVEAGKTTSLTISATDTVGDVSISSNAPNIATVDCESWETGPVGAGESKQQNITISGVSEGVAIITFKYDGANFSTLQEYKGQQSITVTVTAPQNNNGGGSGGLIPVQPSNNNNNNNSNNNNSNNDNNKQEDKKEEKKSDNSKIKTLTVDNYNLKKINDNKYELIVDNKVNMVNIKAVAADSKATVKGNGVHELTVGENKIEIVITAEDGSKNTITIIVTREEESVEVEPTTTIGTTDSEPENKINIISIIMIGLNIVLGIAVITLFIKNKKLKDSLIINK